MVSSHRDGPGRPDLDERGDEALDADDSHASYERRAWRDDRGARREAEPDHDATVREDGLSPSERADA
jgi:hypothetical protein